jgi:hypothetical protein
MVLEPICFLTPLQSPASPQRRQRLEARPPLRQHFARRRHGLDYSKFDVSKRWYRAEDSAIGFPP